MTALVARDAAPAGAAAKAVTAVTAVLDDAGAAALLMEASAALAQLTRRPLQVVYVESADALAAAALPVTQVLAHAAHGWAPLAPQDVERGWRWQVERLRALAQSASRARAVSWSLRVTRGSLRATAGALHAQADLLLLASAPPRVAPRAARRVVALDDGSAEGAQAVRLATQLAGLLEAQVRTQRVPAGAADLPAPREADLLVVPRGLAGPGVLAGSAVPVLVVGA